MERFKGKVALITGGSSGLGKATAEAFAIEGAKVVIAARREELGKEAAAAISAAGGQAAFVSCDITNEDQTRSLIDRVLELHGRLDFAYNNAWSAPHAVPLAEMPTDSFDKELALLRGTFLCMKYQIPAMAKGAGGVIVNCSSLASQMPRPGLVAYGAAKAGLEALVRSAASEYADKNIRVNSICSGGFKTPTSDEYVRQLPPAAVEAFFSRVPLKRLGLMNELAQTVLFLCSDAAGYITGINLVVDGGFHLT